MNSRGLLALSSLIVLAACDTPDEVSEIEVEETIVEEEEAEPSTSETETHDEEPSNLTDQDDEEMIEANPVINSAEEHVFINLVDAETFSNEQGAAAWDDYQSILKEVTISELFVEEEMGGSTSEEVDAAFQSFTNIEDSVTDFVEVTGNEQMVIYRYPANDETNEMAEYSAELTFYFYDNHLIFTAITPGFYSVDLEGLPTTEELADFMTVSEIEALDSKVYTVAEMIVLGDVMHQTMVPAMGIDDEGNEVVSAFYFFTRGDEIIQFAHLPFELPSIDFPTYSILLFQEIISTLEGV